jgi:mannitol/fructose-specific phosphotransferase system IIA component (Ntr-type)
MKLSFKPSVFAASNTEWFTKATAVITSDGALQEELVDRLRERERMGSTMINLELLMPHVVTNDIDESAVVISQLATPIKDVDGNEITTGIFIFSLPNDEQVAQFINYLLQDNILAALCDRNLSQQQLERLLS